VLWGWCEGKRDACGKMAVYVVVVARPGLKPLSLARLIAAPKGAAPLTEVRGFHLGGSEGPDGDAPFEAQGELKARPYNVVTRSGGRCG
jgi:hypothetical protein